MAARPEGSPAPGAFTEPRSQPPPDVAERLVRENLGWLRGWVRGRIRDPEAVDDICQEAFLKALRASQSLHDLSKFPQWLYRIAENTLRDHLRRQARRRRWLLVSDQLDERPAPDRSGAEEASEEAARVLAAVRELPPRYREPLLLKHAEDLPYARIGEILGITENAVQVRIFRARKMLRKKLGLPEGAVSLK
jgi:RNA polymerase sigma factor (sigma-70 family)